MLSVDSKVIGIAIEHRNPKITRGSTLWSERKTTYTFIVMVRFCIPLRCWLGTIHVIQGLYVNWREPAFSFLSV